MNDADEDDAADNNFGLIQCATEMLQSACRVEEDLRARTGFAGEMEMQIDSMAGRRHLLLHFLFEPERGTHVTTTAE